jgi:predicted phage terminase large subunit-like protein
MIKAAWLARYQVAPDLKRFVRIVLTCDPAGKAGENNDYTAITIVGVQEKALHLLHVSRGHWTVMQMLEQIIALAAQWKVDLIIIEDTASGMSLKQLLGEQTYLEVGGRRPDADKETRVCRHQGRFEAGRILLPVEAPWLADFEAELLAFPFARYDDQVDALLLFLDWYAQHEQYIHPLIVCVPDLSRPDPWPDFSPRWNEF